MLLIINFLRAVLYRKQFDKKSWTTFWLNESTKVRPTKQNISKISRQGIILMQLILYSTNVARKNWMKTFLINKITLIFNWSNYTLQNFGNCYNFSQKWTWSIFENHLHRKLTILLQSCWLLWELNFNYILLTSIIFQNQGVKILSYLSNIVQWHL